MEALHENLCRQLAILVRNHWLEAMCECGHPSWAHTNYAIRDCKLSQCPCIRLRTTSNAPWQGFNYVKFARLKAQLGDM